jgi:hypothetical protein
VAQTIQAMHRQLRPRQAVAHTARDIIAALLHPALGKATTEAG